MSQQGEEVIVGNVPLGQARFIVFADADHYRGEGGVTMGFDIQTAARAYANDMVRQRVRIYWVAKVETIHQIPVNVDEVE